VNVLTKTDVKTVSVLLKKKSMPVMSVLCLVGKDYLNDDKRIIEMALEELWELFPIILKKYIAEYPKWYEIERKKWKRNLFFIFRG
jgi:hypothetical protein